MEATTLLILIVLTVVGARNIPANMYEPSGELQQIFGDSITSSANTIPQDEVFYKDPVENTVSTEDLEPISNKDFNEEEKSEDRDDNVAALDTEEAKNFENKPKEDDNQEITTTVMNPVEVTNEDKEAQRGIEDREGIKVNHCPGGTRIGDLCWKEDKA